MIPTPVKEMKAKLKFKRHMEAQNGNEANMLDSCIMCQETKRYAFCPAECPNIAVQK